MADTTERELAEQRYVELAHDYESNPIGSRDWVIFWNGWRERSELAATPPADAGMESLAAKEYMGELAYADKVLANCTEALKVLSTMMLNITETKGCNLRAGVMAADELIANVGEARKQIAKAAIHYIPAHYARDMPADAALAELADYVDQIGLEYEYDSYPQEMLSKAAAALRARQPAAPTRTDGSCGPIMDIHGLQPAAQVAQSVPDAERVITAESELVEGGIYVIRSLPHVDDPEFAKGKLQYFTRNADHLGRLRLWKHFNGNYEALAVRLPEFPAMLAASQQTGGA